MGGYSQIYIQFLSNWCGVSALDRTIATSTERDTMKKVLRSQGEDEPVTMELLSKTWRDHTSSQPETNSEFRAAIRALEEKSMSKIEDLERKS